MSLPIIDRSARVQYTATAGQTSFVVPFEFFENSNLVVYRGTTQLTQSVTPTTADQYSVTGAGVEGGGTITLGAGATLGDVVTILRDVPVERLTDFPTSGPFQIEALNAELARIVTMVQQQETMLAGRVLRLADFDTPASLLTLPSAAERAGRVLAFNEAGAPAQGPDIAEVATLAASVSNIAIVAGSIGNVNTVAGSVGSVNTIAPHIGSIQVAATNIAAIIAAPGHAADAANSALYAEAMTGPTYASTAAGLAATTSGQGFAVDNGDNTFTVYQNVAGSAVAQRTVGTIAYIDAAVTAAQTAQTNAETAEAGAEAAVADGVATAQANANLAVTNAEAARDGAISAKTAAESARDATIVGAAPTVYASTAEGLAATTNGQYFSVVAADPKEYLILYLNSSGSAVEQRRYPSIAKLDQIFDTAPAGYEYVISDGVGGIALGVKSTGEVVTEELTPTILNIGEGDGEVTKRANGEYIFAIGDANGNLALTIDREGNVDLGLSSTAVSTVERYGGTYSAQLNYICNAGQSLAQGSDGQVTTAQEYDNIGFAFGTSNPTVTYPLTTSQTGSSSQESPMYGTAGHIKELILEEQDLTYQVNDYQLLCGNVGSSGAPIEEINKGGSRGRYEMSITQVQSGYNIATSAQQSFAFQAVTWTQGESNDATPKDTYKTLLKQLAADYNTDGKAITGQKHDVQFISYQLCRTGSLNTVTPAQLEASEEVAYIHIATPTYFMDFYDGVHLTAAGSKWLGGYYGLCYKRTVIDRKEWAPLKPVSHTVVGNSVVLTFNKEALVFDTTMMPAQTNYGFTATDSGGTPVTITSVAIVGTNRVRLIFASTPQPGWRIKYGHINVTGKTNYTGPGGNLRDSQGNTIVYSAISKPMHNWCVIFNYEV